MPVVIAVVVIAVIAAVVVLARRGAGRASERIEGRLAGLDVVRKDRATLQRRDGDPGGRGVLALTLDSLVFVQFVPDREISVPRSAITSVAGGDDAVELAWGEESATWTVPDGAAWRAELGPGHAPDAAGAG